MVWLANKESDQTKKEDQDDRVEARVHLMYVFAWVSAHCQRIDQRKRTEGI